MLKKLRTLFLKQALLEDCYAKTPIRLDIFSLLYVSHLIQQFKDCTDINLKFLV